MNKIIDIFLKGGPVMWPILGLSVLGLAICLWKACQFRRGPKTARGLVFVSTIITAEPMLGILGTVVGIMQTFGALNGADGAANPMGATRGIGEALITTAAGLIIAIPGVVAYNFFQKKVEEWNMELEASIAGIVAAVGA